MIFAVGLSFKTAPVEVREKLAVAPSRLQEAARQLATEEKSGSWWFCQRVQSRGDLRRSR